MNIRELWDTVVLRDLLGYVFPGGVTLFGLALLLKGATGSTATGLTAQLAKWVGLGMLSDDHWLRWQPWLAAAVLLPLSYVVGHLQIWITEYFEKPGRPMYNGKQALTWLEKQGQMGQEYCNAARQLAGAEHFATLCTYLWATDREGKEGAARDQVKADDYERLSDDLWRFCDRYVLTRNRDAHAMFMGRYYILMVLFLNLGVSSIMLGFSFLALPLRSCQSHDLQAAPVLILAAILVLIGVGLGLIYRSLFFRKRFVECTFQLFYAMTRGKEHPYAQG